MASERLSSYYPWYVVTDDSDIQPDKWQTPFFKFTVLTFSLITVAVVSLYFAGIISGEEAVEEVVDENFPIVELDATKDVSCESYSIIVDNCTDISADEITENGCISYVERSGGICANGVNGTLCVVNEDCATAHLVDNATAHLVDYAIRQSSTLVFNGETEASCSSYSELVDACVDVSVEEISENGCLSYVDSTGGICVYFDDSKTLCVVNEDCEKVDIVELVSVY